MEDVRPIVKEAKISIIIAIPKKNNNEAYNKLSHLADKFDNTCVYDDASSYFTQINITDAADTEMVLDFGRSLPNSKVNLLVNGVQVDHKSLFK